MKVDTPRLPSPVKKYLNNQGYRTLDTLSLKNASNAWFGYCEKDSENFAFTANELNDGEWIIEILTSVEHAVIR